MFFKQKTAYEMRISDWSSDVCSSDLRPTSIIAWSRNRTRRGIDGAMASHHARKRFGQHFLTDESVIDAIVRAIGPKAKDVMVEIGPGLPALTAPLPDGPDHLTVVELDRSEERRGGNECVSTCRS